MIVTRSQTETARQVERVMDGWNGARSGPWVTVKRTRVLAEESAHGG